jgi:hypothetical protein
MYEFQHKYCADIKHNDEQHLADREAGERAKTTANDKIKLIFINYRSPSFGRDPPYS